MLARIARFFWPDVTDQQFKKYGLLSMAFFFIIGAYWLERPLKDGVFFTVVGKAHQPTAKILSVLIVGLLVMVYSKLIDIFEKQKLFYILGSTYIILFAFIAYVIGLPRTGPDAVNPDFLRYVGWMSYFVIESFGSLIVALFWSFVASMTDTETAKRCYPMVLAGAQIGAIVGPFIAWKYAETWGLRILFAIVIVAVFVLIGIIKYFMKVIPADQITVGKQEIVAEKKGKTGFLEGLKLLLTRSYLFGIFMVVTIYEVVGTIVDYQMKVQAQSFYPTQETLTSFLGMFGMCANSLALLMALLGTAYLMKKFSLRFCLLTFPITLGAAVAGLYVVYAWQIFSAWYLLWATFAVMMIAKGLSYALNNPSKEMMYIPTSKDAKFKSKGWIDMFGGRVSKAGGSTFNEFLKSSPEALMAFGTLLSLGMIGIWIVAAIFVSSKFDKLVKENKIVE